MSIDLAPTILLAGVSSAVALGAVVRLAVPSPRRLRSRLSPYVAPHVPARSRGGPVASVFGPILQDLADRVASALDRSGREAVVLKLRQAGWFPGVGEGEALSRYRVIQFRTLLVAIGLALVVGWMIEASVVLRLTLLGLALVVGMSRSRGRLDRAVEQRREQMKVEIYTVNQLLAMRVRAGGGVIQAVRGITQRGRGEVVSELEEAFRLHRAGWSAPDAFRRIAEITPEPFCSRTYRLLAAAEERGADLAVALLSLSEDVRETRRESIKRNSTKRRAAMLVPTIAILAPVLILFVAAPLPYLITSWR